MNDDLLKRIEALEAKSYKSDVSIFQSVQRALRTLTLQVGSAGATESFASALIALTSITKGFLFSRMTTTQRDAIVNPVQGLVIYNTTTSALNFYNGSVWGAIGGGTPGGSDTQIQFNDGGAFGGDAALKWDKTSDFLIMGTSAGTVEIQTPDGAASGEDGGNLSIVLGMGHASASGFGGDFVLTAGSAGSGSGADGGDISLTGNVGDGAGEGSDIILTSGDGGSSGAGGDINLNMGVGNGGGANGRLHITGLPTSSAGLATGDVWSNSGVLTIV